MKPHLTFQQHTRPPNSVAQSLDPAPKQSRLTGRVLRYAAGFTLLELLVVLSILGLIAALALPVMNNFKPNYTANATRALLDELARARQLAMSQRTTVYMVFVQTNFWLDPAFGSLSADDKLKAANLYDKQLIGYAFVSLRSMGDQPGQPRVRYLSEWKTLPEGAFIAPYKFSNLLPGTFYTNDFAGNPFPAFPMRPFPKTRSVPFPSETAVRGSIGYVELSYLAFDYMGRLVRFNEVNGQSLSPLNDLIPLAKGNMIYSRDQRTKLPLAALPTPTEQPPGNWTNAYNLVWIDWLTGRARGIQQEVR